MATTATQKTERKSCDVVQQQVTDKMQQLDLTDEERCTAMTMHRGRCQWPRVKNPTSKDAATSAAESGGVTLCCHHLADQRRGCSAAHQTWQAAGAKQLKPQNEGGGDGLCELQRQLSSPLIAIRVHAAHITRVQARMQQALIGCSLAFAEKTRKGKTVLLLFTPPPHHSFTTATTTTTTNNHTSSHSDVIGDEEARAAMLLATVQAVVADAYMLRVLAGLPAVVCRATPKWSEAKEFFTSALSDASCDTTTGDSSRLLRTVVDPVVRTLLNNNQDINNKNGSSSNNYYNTSRNKDNNEEKEQEDRKGGNNKEKVIAEASATAADVTGPARLVCVLSVYEGAQFLCGELQLPAAALNALLLRYQQVAQDRGAQRVCKAVHKIEEMFSVRDWGPNHNADELVALDIGASPGSWTAWLLQHMQRHRSRSPTVSGGGLQEEQALRPRPRVVAVDPGDLAPEVLALDGVQHVRVFVAKEDPASMALIASAVQGGDHNRQADLLVCDMNRHPSEAAALLEAVSSSGLLAEGARVVLTLKLTVKAATARAQQESEALAALGHHFVDPQVHHLFGNTGFEAMVTAVYRRSPSN